MLQVLGLIAVASLIMVSLNLCMKLYTSRRTGGHVRLEGDELLVVAAQEMTPPAEGVSAPMKRDFVSMHQLTHYLSVEPRRSTGSSPEPGTESIVNALNHNIVCPNFCRTIRIRRCCF